jgi:voltage-gated potassium channel
MYFVSRGELEVVSKDGQTVFSTLTDGDFFGEIALILKQPRTASVRATTYCDLYRLDRELFERVLSHYPEVAAKIQERAEERSARN